MADVVVRNLTKRFGDVEAVKNVSLEIRNEEFVVLLGPSGCGKTTALRCIAGLEKPDSGEIYIGDSLVNPLPAKDRDVAMVFQSYALYPHMRVYDNLAFPLRTRKVSRGEMDRKVREVAELLRITHLLDRKPKQLSGGEAQRVALGRSIVRKPKVFLMDEPLSNLDAKLRLYMRVELKKLQRDLGITTLYVTHDQAEALTMADRVAVMSQGELQQVSEPTGLYSHPANLFVAGFIGSPPMNFFECSFAESDGNGVLQTETFQLVMESDISEIIREKAQGNELILGLRPEDLFLGEPTHEQYGIPGEVYVIETLGAETIVDAKVAGEIVKVREKPYFQAPIGQKVTIGFSKNRLHLYDRKTGLSLI